MKRAFLATNAIILTLLCVALWGKHALQGILDAELAPLLSREIGIEVNLAPISAELATMTASTSRLVMGDGDRPAVVAADVVVGIDWRALLRAELRLVSASAAELMLAPSRWPASNDPTPANYDFLEPLLPARMEVASGRYIGPDGDDFQASQLLWLRSAGGASLTWQQGLNHRTVDFSAKLHSLGELLQLARLRLQLNMQDPENENPAVRAELDLQPGKTSGYQLHADLAAAGMTARIEASSPVSWQLPDQSSTRMPVLDIVALRELAAAFSDPENATEQDLLAGTLPRLRLPAHSGSVQIDTIRLQDEVATQNSVLFTTGGQGIELTSVTSTGPTGELQGRASVASSSDGWRISLLADITATGSEHGLAPAYLGNDWLWNAGHADLRGSGATWGQLLDSLQGEFNLAGVHRGETDTPVSIEATLDNRPGKLIVDDLEVKLAGGTIRGELSLSGEPQRKLTGKVTAEQLQLGFLAPEEKHDNPPGVPFPTITGILPGIDLYWEASVKGLEYGRLRLASIDVTLTRTPEHSELSAQVMSMHQGNAELRLTANTPAGEDADVSLRMDMTELNLQRVFGGSDGVLAIHTSGSIVTTARGTDLEEVLGAMRGKADLVSEIHGGGTSPNGRGGPRQFTLQGNARLVLAEQRIIGLDISELALEAAGQNLGGELSLVAGRTPWLIAKLTSNKMDIDTMMDMLRQPEDSEADPVSLRVLRDVGAARISLHASSLKIRDLELPRVVLELSSAEDRIRLQKLNIETGGGRLKSSGDLVWQGQTATMQVDISVASFSLEPLLAQSKGLAPVPVSGSVKLQSSGSTTSMLFANLVGDINLRGSESAKSAGDAADRELLMSVRRTGDGMEMVVKRLLWGETDLTGKLVYIDGSAPAMNIELSGGTLSLLPWAAEDSASGAAKTERREGLSIVTETARTGIDFVGSMILSPFSWATGPKAATAEQRVFSDTPLPFETLRNFRATIKGNLDKVITREANMQDLTLSVSLANGLLKGMLETGRFIQGEARIDLRVDASRQPAPVELKGTFNDLRSDDSPGGFTRSGHFDLSSRGQSQAELAANLDGIVYLELGEGLLQYNQVGLLTADVATEVFRALIPVLKQQQPHLECAVILGVFTSGRGLTPYGFAARTREANLVGRLQVDLAKETMQADFSSSNRRGIGISVSSVFSNTVEISGPLSNPTLVPNTAGLLWRGWAAMMTGGLSILGESMFRRVLASDNPCDSLEQHIQEDFCPKNPAAAASPMICPAS